MYVWLELKHHYTGDLIMVNMSKVQYFEPLAEGVGSFIRLSADADIRVRETYAEIHERLKGAK